MNKKTNAWKLGWQDWQIGGDNYFSPESDELFPSELREYEEGREAAYDAWYYEF